MNKQEKCGYWLMLSDYDIGTIDTLIKNGKKSPLAGRCQR